MSIDKTTTLAEGGVPPNASGTHSTAGARVGFLRQWPISLRSTLLLVLALGLVVGSIALSQNSVTSSNPHFIELWMVPQPVAAGANAKAAEVGVQNTQTSDVDVIVRVSEGSRVVFTKDLTHLAPGQSWTHSFEREVSQKLSATVRYAAQPTKVVRNVYLQSPSN